MKKQILILILILSSSIFAQDLQISNSQISSAMLSQISVTIGGDFITEGTFTASSNERVDQFVTRVYNTAKQAMYVAIKDNQSLIQFKKDYDNYSKRNIEIKHFDGTSEKLDLAKFRLDADYNQNPYLKNGDVIIFPVLDLERNFISIDGAVNNPTKIQFVEGDNLQTALFFARGINKAFDKVEKAEISRISEDGKSEELVKVDINAKTVLKRGDRIRVLFSENNKKDFKVLILGEVNSPGYISITKENTTLKEAIIKAGNFKDNASLEFAKLLRGSILSSLSKNKKFNDQFEENFTQNDLYSLFEDSKLEYLKMLRTASLTLEDSMMFSIDNNLRMLEFSPSFDFKKIDTVGSFENTFKLKDGDIIFIPTKEERIYVWGGVKNPGYFNYNIQKSILDYINAAGGFAETAVGEDEVYLIKGKNREWVKIDFEDGNNYSVESGDYIYAKKTPTRSFDFYLRRTGAIASIVGTVITTLYLIITAGK